METTQPNLKGVITDYLNEAIMMQLATVADSKPWICNVWFAADEDLNIYWISSTTRRHSAEVANNPNVAAAICLPQTPADVPRGIQLEGIAEELTNPSDIETAIKYFAGRIFSPEQIKNFMSNPERPHMFYRIKPSKIMLMDAVNFPENPSQEYRP